MAVPVIHRFEMIDIEEGDAVVAAEFITCRIKAEPVAEASQGVRMAQMQKALVGLHENLHFPRIQPADQQCHRKRHGPAKCHSQHDPVEEIGHEPELREKRQATRAHQNNNERDESKRCFTGTSPDKR